MTLPEQGSVAARRPSRLQAPVAWLLGLLALALVVYAGMAVMEKRAREAPSNEVPALIEALKGTDPAAAQAAIDRLAVLPYGRLQELVPFVDRMEMISPGQVTLPRRSAMQAPSNAFVLTTMTVSGKIPVGFLVGYLLQARLGIRPGSGPRTAAGWESAWDDLYTRCPRLVERRSQ